MKLVIPCDWQIIDLLTEDDPNLFGEALRNLCFVGNGQQKGCYETFDVNKTFYQVTKGEILEEAKKYLFEDAQPYIYHCKVEEKDCYLNYESYGEIENKGKMKICDPYEIVVGWSWDGDGCLYFRFNDRKVLNTDCKKDYTWEWVE